MVWGRSVWLPPGGNLLGKSCPLGFLLVLFYTKYHIWCLCSFPRRLVYWVGCGIQFYPYLAVALSVCLACKASYIDGIRNCRVYYFPRFLLKGSTGNILESTSYRDRTYSNPDYVVTTESSTYQPTVLQGDYEIQDGETGLGWRVVRGSTEAGTYTVCFFC